MPASLPSTVRPQPLIAVADVEASSRWYQELLGLGSGHGGNEYERIGTGDDFVLQLHDWHADEHEHLGDETNPSRGNGFLLWFAIEDFDAALARAQVLAAEVLDGPFVNPNAGQRELWLRDPDGYVVVLAGQPGDLGS